MSCHTKAAPLPEEAGRVAERLSAAKRPLLVSHQRLDGDALGAELGLAHILAARGARPHIVNDSRIPQAYRFMPGIEQVGTSAADLRGDYDLVAMLDNPSWERAAAIRDALPPGLPSVAIDHHPPVAELAQIAWVDTRRSSVGEMVYYMAREAGWVIPPEAATCLYIAILTDTGRFNFPNTSTAALHAAADLVALGAEHVKATERIYQDIPFSFIALQSEAAQQMHFYGDGAVAVIAVTREMLARHGVDPIDTQMLADFPRSIAGVRIGVVLREMEEPGRVKISLRCRSGLNIEPVARAFGGGGHKEASGAEADGQMDDVERRLVAALLPVLGTT